VEPFKTTADLGIARDDYGAERVTVVVEWTGKRLSFVGNRGQNVGSLSEIDNPDTEADRDRLAALWDRWHLNDMRAGCEHQQRGARAGFGAPIGAVCAVCGYSNGSEWRTEAVPEDVLAEVRGIMRRLDFAPEPEPVEVEDFPHGDVIDTRTLIGNSYGPAIDAELANAENYTGEWNDGATLIAADYFTEYARQYADDIGAVKDDHGWPLDHMDWDAAARALQQDYTRTTIDGRDYWIR
jgi:hypothetical protein